MPIAKRSRGKAQAKSQQDTLKQLQLIVTKLDKVVSRLDTAVSLALDFLLSDPKYDKPIAYTDKVERLASLGTDQEAISGIVRRPSNYVSSRLRESRNRAFSRRQKRAKKSAGPNSATLHGLDEGPEMQNR